MLSRILGACAVGSALGCGETGPKPLRIPLSELSVGGRLEVELTGTPVEVRRRTPTSVKARSLLCTHLGCRVVWRKDEGEYVCPCHQGRFDDSGQVLDGPPSRPLAEIPTRVEGGQIVVGS